MMTVACDNAEEIMEILMQDANTHQLINYQINDVLVSSFISRNTT